MDARRKPSSGSPQSGDFDSGERDVALADARSDQCVPRVLVSRAALLHNVSVIRGHLKPLTRLCAVVKADAYGHGARPVVDALCNFSGRGVEAPAVDVLAVATIDEASGIADIAGDVPIMILRPVENIYIGRERHRLEAAILAGWTLTVCSSDAAGDVARIALALGRRAAVQIMLDTGMNREGAAVDRYDAVLRAVEATPSLKLSALCTHFACADSPADPTTAEQLAQFETATQIRAWKTPGLLRHASNSGAVFFNPSAQFDMVRPGLAVYGIDPTGKVSVDRPLRPALKWIAPILLVRDVPRGQPVGYGASWIAPRDSRIGLVPIGYADGYLRCWSNRAVMRVGRRFAPVVGRVSMDSVMIDLTDIPQVQAGEPAVVLDDDPLSPASVYALAQLADTIPYEILCRIGNRVARIAVEPADARPA